jgi:hypothetical protein
VNRPAARAPRTLDRSRSRAVVAASLAVLLLVSLVLLTGCNIQAGVDTTVNTDASGTVGMRLVADKELQDALAGVAGGVSGLGGRAGTILGILGDIGAITGAAPTTVDDLFNLIVGQIPGDWQVERGVDSSGARWITISRSFANPEELQQILSGAFLSAVVETQKISLTQDQGFFATKTMYSATAAAGSITSRGETVTRYLQVVLGDVLTVENRVTLPGEIKDNNADEVQGNTLVWNMQTAGAREMSAESAVNHWGAIIGMIVLGVVVVAGLIVALVLILRRRRKPGPQPPAADQAVPPAPPQTADSPETQASDVAITPPAVAESAAAAVGPAVTAAAPVTPPPVVAATVAVVTATAAEPEATAVPSAAQAASVTPAPVPAPAPLVAPESAAPVAAASGPAPAQAPAAPLAAASAPAPAQAVPAAAVAVAAAEPAAAADQAPETAASKPVVPIPLRPTKAQPGTNDTPDAAGQADS